MATAPQSGHGPKGQWPIHVKVAGAVRVRVCVGKEKVGSTTAEEAYLKAGVYLKGAQHKARHTSNTPRHIFTFLLFPGVRTQNTRSGET